MYAQWHGGPLDGAYVQLPDNVVGYAVAYDETGRMLDPWDELQLVVSNPDHVDPTAHLRGVAVVVMYPVERGKIWFGEKLITVREAEE